MNFTSITFVLVLLAVILCECQSGHHKSISDGKTRRNALWNRRNLKNKYNSDMKIDTNEGTNLEKAALRADHYFNTDKLEEDGKSRADKVFANSEFDINQVVARKSVLDGKTRRHGLWNRKEQKNKHNLDTKIDTSDDTNFEKADLRMDHFFNTDKLEEDEMNSADKVFANSGFDINKMMSRNTKNIVQRQEKHDHQHDELHSLQKKLRDSGLFIESKEKEDFLKNSIVDKARDGVKKIMHSAKVLPTLAKILKSSVRKVQTHCLEFVKSLSLLEDGLKMKNRDNHEFATYLDIINKIVIEVATLKKQELQNPLQAFNKAANAGYSTAMSNYASNATEKVDTIYIVVESIISKLQPLHDFIDTVPLITTATEYLELFSLFAEEYPQADLMILGHMAVLDLIDYFHDFVYLDLTSNLGEMGAGRYVVLRKSQSESVIIKFLLLNLVLYNIDD